MLLLLIGFVLGFVAPISSQRDYDDIKSALRHADRGDFESSLEQLEIARKKCNERDNCGFVYGLRGSIHDKVGNLEKAIKDLRKAISLSDHPVTQISYHYELGDLYLMKLEDIKNSIHHYEKTIGLLKVMDKNIPDFQKELPRQYQTIFFATHRNIGEIYRSHEGFINYKKSYVHLSKAIEMKHPTKQEEQISALLSRVKLIRECFVADIFNKVDVAISDYTEILRYFPNDVDYLIERGQTYLFAEKYKQALNDFKSVVKLEPDNIEGHIHIGEVYKFQEQFHKAINQYRKAIKILPECQRCYHAMGDVFTLAIGNIIKKEDELSTKTISENKKVMKYYELGMESYRKAREIEDMWQLYSSEGSLLCLIGKYEEGLEKALQAEDRIDNSNHLWMVSNVKSYCTKNMKEKVFSERFDEL